MRGGADRKWRRLGLRFASFIGADGGANAERWPSPGWPSVVATACRASCRSVAVRATLRLRVTHLSSYRLRITQCLRIIGAQRLGWG